MKLACLDYPDREYCQLAVERARAQSRRERERHLLTENVVKHVTEPKNKNCNKRVIRRNLCPTQE